MKHPLNEMAAPLLHQKLHDFSLLVLNDRPTFLPQFFMFGPLPVVMHKYPQVLLNGSHFPEIFLTKNFPKMKGSIFFWKIFKLICTMIYDNHVCGLQKYIIIQYKKSERGGSSRVDLNKKLKCCTCSPKKN